MTLEATIEQIQISSSNLPLNILQYSLEQTIST